MSQSNSARGRRRSLVLLACAFAAQAVVGCYCGPTPDIPPLPLPEPPDDSVPAAPTGVSARAETSSSIEVDWDEVTGADRYRVVANQGASFDVDVPPFLHDGIAPDTAVTYVVHAVNDAGESPASDEASATTPSLDAPPAPIGLAASVTGGEVELAWSESAGATRYTLYWATSSGVDVASASYVRGVTSPFRHAGLSPGQTGYYVVTAGNAGGESAPSSEASATLPAPSAPAAPTNVTITPADRALTLDWDEVAGATAYHLFVSTSADVDTETAARLSFVQPPYLHQGLQNGVARFYVVTAVGPGGESAPSAEVSASPQAGPPAAPVVVSVIPGVEDATLEVQWSLVQEADAYRVLWGTASGVATSGTATEVTDLAVPPYTIPSVDPSLVYYAVVYARNDAGEGPVSAEASGHLPLDPPRNLNISTDIDTVTLTWDAPTDDTPDGYTLYFTTTSPFDLTQATAIPDVTSPHEHAGLLPDTTYRYAVVATLGAVESEPEGLALATTSPAAPAGLSATAGNNRVDLAWDAVPGVDSYTVYWDTAAGVTAGAATVVPDVLTTAWRHVGVTDAQTYYYRVTSTKNGLESALSEERSATAFVQVPQAPTGLTAEAGDGQVALTWPYADGASAYDIYAQDSAAGVTVEVGNLLVADVEGTAFVDITAINDVTRYYVVVAKNSLGESGPSPEASATPFAASPPRFGGGSTHVLLLTPEGRLWAWGDNFDGQLGDGTYAGADTPIEVDLSGLSSGIRDLAVGADHSVLLLRDRTVWAWGDNGNGQVGDPAQNDYLAPTPVLDEAGTAPLADVVALAAGYEHTIAITADGNAWTFGRNSYGQLGRSAGATDLPGRVTDNAGTGLFVGAAAAAGGARHTLLLDGNGDVWSFGSNLYGQLGLGDTVDASTPTKLDTLADVAKIAAGEYTSAAITDGGDLYVWGIDRFGEIGGVGTETCGTPACATSPTLLPELMGVTVVDLRMSSSHGLVLTDDGEVWAFGASWAGQTGLESLPDETTPVRIESLVGATVTAVGAAEDVSHVYTAAGELYGFGDGEYAPLGTGVVELPSGDDNYVAAPELIAPVEGISAAGVWVTEFTSFLFDDTGALYGCGLNGDGEVSLVTTDDAYTPLLVDHANAPTGVTMVASGLRFAVAKDGTGALKAWGEDTYGQLGDGPTDSTGGTVVDVDTSAFAQGAEVTKLVAGDGRVHALLDDGTLWTWGRGGTPMLGDGSELDQPAPVPVCVTWDAGGGTCTTPLTDVVDVSAGYEHSLAVTSDGTVWSWGYNFAEGLGDDGAHRPVAMPAATAELPSGVKAVKVAAGQHSLALLEDGSVWAWGVNGQGELGRGTTGPPNTPAAVDLSLVPGDVTIVGLAAGRRFSVLLGDDGSLWTFGDWSSGQTGHGDALPDNPRIPTRVFPLDAVVITGVTARALSAVAWTADGRAFAWGGGGYGQLCLGSTEDSTAPRPMTGVGGRSL